MVIGTQPIQLITQTTLLEKTLEEILKDINTQVLEIKYVINLGQLLKIMPNIKRYIFKLVTYVPPMQLELIQPKPTYEQLVDLLSEPVEGGLFDVEPNSSDILVVVPTHQGTV